MIVDKKLRGVKCVQTLSRLNRICEGKTDTFILDFVNSAEDIQEAFQPFYQETSLSQEINVDLIYQVVKEINSYGLYTYSDVEKFVALYQKESASKNAMGKMTSLLKPTADNYNALSKDEKYKFRRLLRSFIKWYGYISQVARIFDKDLHKEYLFCAYLLYLIPNDPVIMIDIEGALKLEYYKLEKTFTGTIALDDADGEYDPASSKSTSVPEKKEPLEEVIERINLLFAGNFTDADRVILFALHEVLKEDKKLRKTARSSNPQIFIESIFPKIFEKTAQESYVEQTDAYTSLFQDKSKYTAIMSALAETLYREFNAE
jgi:type I restriction enzyme R subunit